MIGLILLEGYENEVGCVSAVARIPPLILGSTWSVGSTFGSGSSAVVSSKRGDGSSAVVSSRYGGSGALSRSPLKCCRGIASSGFCMR